VPVVVSLAALEMVQLMKRRPALVYLVTATQLITLLLTYQFQDLIF
ncbi:MAG: hypothetical protein IH586_06810, partial [Anaerolineaceae bacterium]|nr:hypothetical protein [Anaerolineaceae bacterium]